MSRGGRVFKKNIFFNPGTASLHSWLKHLTTVLDLIDRLNLIILSIDLPIDLIFLNRMKVYFGCGLVIDGFAVWVSGVVVEERGWLGVLPCPWFEGGGGVGYH